MPINPLGFLPKAWAARLFDATSAPRLPNMPPSNTGGAHFNSSPRSGSQVDDLDSTTRPVAPTRVGSSTAVTSPVKNAKAGDPLGWAAKATGFAVKAAGVLGGFALVIFGGMKVLAAMTAIAGAGPLFATGVGLCVAGATAYKLGGIISKAIRG